MNIRVSKKTRRIITISLLLVIVFGLGVAIGRLTKKPIVEKEIVYAKEETSTKVEVKEVEEEDVNLPKSEWMTFIATGYCPCEKCCGKWSKVNTVDGVTNGACGLKLTEGFTIAADTDVLPFGTRVEVEGMGTYVVHDTGSKVKGNHIDFFFDTHEEAEAFGKKEVKLRIVGAR